MLHPISAEVLHQVFSPYGFVEKIIGCENYYGFQALIEYQFRHSAISAWNSLQRRNLYDGCCLLEIQFSTIDQLRLHYHEDRLPLQPEPGDSKSILDRMEKSLEEIKTQLMRLSGNSSSSTVTDPPPTTGPEIEPAYADEFLDSESSKFTSVSPSFFTSPNIPDEDVALSVSRVTKIDGTACDDSNGCSALEISLDVELESIIADGKGLKVIDRKEECSVDLEILDVCLSLEELDFTNSDNGDVLVDENVHGESFSDLRDLEPVFQAGCQVSGMRNCFNVPTEFKSSSVMEVDFLGVDARIEMLQLGIWRNLLMDCVELAAVFNDRVKTLRKKCGNACFVTFADFLVHRSYMTLFMSCGKMVKEDVRWDYRKRKKLGTWMASVGNEHKSKEQNNSGSVKQLGMTTIIYCFRQFSTVSVLSLRTRISKGGGIGAGINNENGGLKGYEEFTILWNDGVFGSENLQLIKTIELPSMLRFFMILAIGIPTRMKNNGVHSHSHFLKQRTENGQLFECTTVHKILHGNQQYLVDLGVSLRELLLWWMVDMKGTKKVKQEVQWDYKRYKKKKKKREQHVCLPETANLPL